MSLWAWATQYGDQNLVYSGPIYKSHVIEGNRIRIKFDHVGTGLKTSDGNQLEGFAIAGKDREFIWAHAVIDGNDVLVSAPSISNLVSVRYNWANNPIGNLINKEGLQASLFRTDNWDRITKGRY